jgi:hypothetical protein
MLLDYIFLFNLSYGYDKTLLTLPDFIPLFCWVRRSMCSPVTTIQYYALVENPVIYHHKLNSKTLLTLPDFIPLFCWVRVAIFSFLCPCPCRYTSSFRLILSHLHWNKIELSLWWYITGFILNIHGNLEVNTTMV